jgi:hypothetical protein
MNLLLDAQEGGKMEASKDSGGGPKIGANTIDMKIQLVNDASLPSYLIPSLTCDNGSTPIPNSKVSITLTGDSLRKETAPGNFKCEITSNFLTDKEKSAITIETYYVDSSGGGGGSLLGTNTIYFDESLLSYYNDKNELKKSDNPFLATATTPDNGATYTFEFDFDKIIKYIKALPSYAQIQNMFKFVNGILSATGTTLINISAGGFLNLKFSGVPFNTSHITTESKLTLNIATTNNPVPSGCELKKLFGSDILTGHLHKVLELSEYKDFYFSGIAADKSPATPPPHLPPVDPTAAATAAAEKKATEVKIAAKLVIEKAVDGIKTKIESMSPEDNAKIPEAVKTFIDASKALAVAKDGKDTSAIAKAEAALKSASAASGLKEAIDEGLADGSTPTDVKDVLKNAKIIQDEHVKMDAADAEVVNTKAAVNKVNTAPITSIPTSSSSSPNAEITNLRAQLKAATKNIDELNKKLEQAEVAASRQSMIVATNASECGKGGISMESKGGSFIFKVPYNMIISEIAPNMRAVIAQNVLENNAANSDAATSASLLLKPAINAGGLVVVDDATKIALQQAKNDLDTANQNFKAAKSKLTGLNLTTTSSESIEASKFADAVDATQTKAPHAIAEADSAVKIVTTLETLATAKQKVADATAMVLAVTEAVKKFSDAVDEAEKAKTAAAGAGGAATLDQAVIYALAKAKTDLATEQKRLKDAGNLPAPDKVAALERAISEAEAAVAALKSAADDAAKDAALKDAKTKIAALAALVTAATTAVDAEIVAKQARDIQELTSKLKKDATDVLAAAKIAYGAITTPPTPAIVFTPVSDLITTATAAIATATNADAADAVTKTAAIATATTAVNDAIAAAKAAKEKVEAAAAVPTIPNMFTKVKANVTKAIQLVPSNKPDDIISEEVKNAASTAALDAQYYNNSLTTQDSEITDAVAAITSMTDSVTNSKIIILLEKLDKVLGDSIPSPPPPESATSELNKAIELVGTAITAVTTAVTTATAAIKASEAADAATAAPDADADAAAAAEGAPATAAAAAAKLAFVKANEQVDLANTAANDALAYAPKDHNTSELKEVTDVRNAVAAIHPPLFPTEYDANSTTTKCNESKKLLETLVRTLQAVLPAVETIKTQAAQAEAQAAAAAAGIGMVQETGEGGSKPKSKSSSSKSKSSSPKNKTKKNHSKSKSSKSKTPKIIMNE